MNATRIPGHSTRDALRARRAKSVHEMRAPASKGAHTRATARIALFIERRRVRRRDRYRSLLTRSVALRRLAPIYIIRRKLHHCSGGK